MWKGKEKLRKEKLMILFTKCYYYGDEIKKNEEGENVARIDDEGQS
jgi:hypothetical protein